MTEIYHGIEVVEGKLGGKACIKGTRIPVTQILEWLEAGESIEEIMEALEGLKRKDVENAIGFAKAVLNGDIRYEVPA